LHKYTFTINITLYRIHKDAQHSGNIFGYSQYCYVSGCTRRFTQLPTCYWQYATLKYSVTYGSVERFSSTHWHTVGRETIVLRTTEMFHVMPTRKWRQETPDTDVERTLLLVVSEVDVDLRCTWWLRSVRRLLSSRGKGSDCLCTRLYV
jgi:hypothetical protein